jgi:hypothetical protein
MSVMPEELPPYHRMAPDQLMYFLSQRIGGMIGDLTLMQREMERRWRDLTEPPISENICESTCGSGEPSGSVTNSIGGSSAVEQRLCKPSAAGSNPAPRTKSDREEVVPVAGSHRSQPPLVATPPVSTEQKPGAVTPERRLATEKSIPLLAPIGQCASCDRRRALLTEAKRRHRKEKSGG